MASLRDIKRRITSVKSTQQITKAMKMVAAAKLQKAQGRLEKIRPYSDAYLRMLEENSAGIYDTIHPLFHKKDAKKVLLIVVTSDKGLCGGFNASIIKYAANYIKENQDKEIQLALIGNKGIAFFNKQMKDKVQKEYRNMMDAITFESAQAVIKYAFDQYLKGKVDAIEVIYNQFKSAMTQILTAETLVPMEIQSKRVESVVYEYEPDFEDVITDLAQEYLFVNAYRIMLESAAGEFGARMTAMSSATDNADDMISNLSLQYNRARQTMITTELNEIVSGAEALKN